jgi:subtilisin family serine protease
MLRVVPVATVLVLVLAVSATGGTPKPFIPNDPDYPVNEPALASMNLGAAWALTQGDPSVVIAVIDSGVVPDPDLRPNLVTGHNILNESSDTTDQNGHGTAMAAIAGAAIDNGIGIAGVCGKCRVMSIKISGADDRHLNSNLAVGINWAVEHGASVINLSRFMDRGLPPYAPLNAAITNALAHGIPVFICAGNNGSNDPTANPLASSNPRAVRVGSFKAESNHGSWVDVAAETDLVTFGPRPSPGGTSSATAVVSGIAGLMLSCNPALTPAEIKQILISTSTPREVDVRASGEVDAYHALLRAGCSLNPPAIVRLLVRTRGGGTVSRRPDDDTYNAGTIVVLRAKSKPHWRFARWEGLCHVKRAVCRVRLNNSSVTTAVFKHT